MIYTVRTISGYSLGYLVLPSRVRQIEAKDPPHAAEIYASEERLLGDPTVDRALAGAVIQVGVRVAGAEGAGELEYRLAPRLRWCVIQSSEAPKEVASGQAQEEASAPPSGT